MLLSCHAIAKSFGESPLFSNISLTLNDNERLGLIGPNGSGKSTLLKIIAGIESLDEGEITRKKDISVVYLPQSDQFPGNFSVEESLLNVLKNKSKLDEAERYHLVHQFLSLGEFEDHRKKTDTLSGGWKKRLSILSALIQSPNLLLLDEPTNHLDLEGILWLERVLEMADFGFVVVTHDRYFLENTVARIVELNRQYPSGYIKVEGAYSEFIIQREAVISNQQQQESVLANKVRRENEWLKRGPKARTTKARYRIDEAYRLKEELGQVAHRNRDNRSVTISFSSTARKTKKLLVASKLAKTIENHPLFKDLSLTLGPKTCIGLLGRNGTGKSTLIQVLSQKIPPDQGDIKTAENVKILAFDQNRAQLNPRESLKRVLAPESDSVIFNGKPIHVISWAKKFLFTADQLEMPVGELSGGEQARTLIARLMLQPADILLLDEPTNDLDIPSLEVLEESLKEFPGGIVLVTHDRFLLDRLTTGLIGFDGKGNTELFSDFHQWVTNQKQLDRPDKKPKNESQSTPLIKPRKLSYSEKRELNQIEEKIANAEKQVALCESQIANPVVSGNTDELNKLCTTLQQHQEKVELFYQRWEELEAIQTAFSKN